MEQTPQHQPGIIHFHLFDQHQVWIDRHGREHLIESMDRGHIGNVILMLRRSSATIYATHLARKALDVLFTGGADSELLAEAREVADPEYEDIEVIADLGDGLIKEFETIIGRPLEPTTRQTIYRALSWMESTPLMRALLREWGDEPVVRTPYDE